MNIQFLFCRRLENIFFWSSNKITKSIFWQLTHCKNYFVLLWFINKIFKDSKMADYVSTYLPTVPRTMDMNNCFKHDWFWLLSWGSSDEMNEWMNDYCLLIDFFTDCFDCIKFTVWEVPHCVVVVSWVVVVPFPFVHLSCLFVW